MCCYYFNFGSKGSARNSSSIKGTPLIRYFWVSKIKSFCCVFLLLYLQKGNNIAKQFIPCEHIKLNSIIHNNIAGLVITILRLRHLDTSHSQVSTLSLASLVTAISSSSATSSSSLGFLLSVIREKRDGQELGGSFNHIIAGNFFGLLFPFLVRLTDLVPRQQHRLTGCFTRGRFWPPSLAL